MTKDALTISQPPVVFTRDGQVFANSRDVAATFGKRHDHVLRDINNLIAQGVPNFGETHSINGQNGQSYRSFDMDREAFSVLVMGFTGQKAIGWKIQYAAAFKAMEEELQYQAAPVADLSDPGTLRTLLLGYTEKVIALEHKVIDQDKVIEVATPKAQFYDAYADASGMTQLTDIGRVLNVGPVKMLRWLVEKRILFRSSKNGPLRAKNEYLKRGWFDVKVTIVNDVSRTQTMVTPKGIQGVAEMLGRSVDLFGHIAKTDRLPLTRH